MFNIVRITLKGIFRDRVFQGIIAMAVLFFFIPSIASLSMRQVTELSVTLSLSLISFILLLLSVFLGATSIWKDIERRYTFSVLSLPLNRSTYVLGRFVGIAVFIFITALFLGAIAFCSIKMSSLIYPPSRPLVWSSIAISILFDALKYIIVVAVSMLVATVSTSFFLPIFVAISTFMAGTITQQVFDYLQTPSAITSVPAGVRAAASVLYYMLPNLSGFDLKVNAIYAIPLDYRGCLLTGVYFVLYVGMVLSGSVMLFNRREMK